MYDPPHKRGVIPKEEPTIDAKTGRRTAAKPKAAFADFAQAERTLKAETSQGSKRFRDHVSGSGQIPP